MGLYYWVSNFIIVTAFDGFEWGNSHIIVKKILWPLVQNILKEDWDIF